MQAFAKKSEYKQRSQCLKIIAQLKMAKTSGIHDYNQQVVKKMEIQIRQ